jgi:hypothetical protein
MGLMKLAMWFTRFDEVHRCNSPEELEAIARFRYQVFVEELQKPVAYADHNKREIRDPIDDEHDVTANFYTKAAKAAWVPTNNCLLSKAMHSPKALDDLHRESAPCLEEVRLHLALALDLDDPAAFEPIPGAEQIVDRLRDVDPTREAVGFHPAGRVHRISPQVVGEL